MDKYELIWKYQNAIVDIYDQENLSSLDLIDNNFVIYGRQIYNWYSEITGKNTSIYGEQFNYFKNFDDIIFCSSELLYFTAHLFLYRPYINNPVKDGTPYYGKMHYPNNQNMESRRYSMFADITSQKAYNFWDRIGDLIASFFPDRIKPQNVFFPSALNAIPDCYQKSENFLWLKNFKETDYSELNNKRRQIVHYTTSDIEFKYRHLECVRDKKAMQVLQTERENLADFYKKHIELAKIGFEKALLFLEEISPELFPDAEHTLL